MAVLVAEDELTPTGAWGWCSRCRRRVRLVDVRGGWRAWSSTTTGTYCHNGLCHKPTQRWVSHRTATRWLWRQLRARAYDEAVALRDAVA